MSRRSLFALIAVLHLLCLSCGGGGSSAPPTAPSNNLPPGGPTPNPNPTTPIPSPPQTFVGTGDIGMCGTGGAEQTARLIDSIGGTVFTTGDNAYMDGSRRNYQECYDPAWGRHKARTRPVPGNHEYDTDPTASGYYEYFGIFAGMPPGYYSYDLGDWHIVALNSAIASSALPSQTRWLQQDLAANTRKCTLAYWHHPLFTSGPNGPNEYMRETWRVLYDANADVIVNGHDHLYERFGPQDPDGRRDETRGIRQFIVGTGGAALYSFGPARPNSDMRIQSTFGVLRFTLTSTGYDWQFIPAGGGAGDAGSGICH